MIHADEVESSGVGSALAIIPTVSSLPAKLHPADFLLRLTEKLVAANNNRCLSHALANDR